jgi:predicted DNA-binding protein (UPF0251 family)
MATAGNAARGETNPPAGTREPQPGLEPTARQLAMEIRAVRLEVQLLIMDYSARLSAGLEQEMKWVVARRQKLEARERSARDEIVALDGYRNDPALSETERRAIRGIDANRDLKPDSDLVRMVAEKENLAQREAELLRLIQQERQRWQEARTNADSLQNELSRMLASAATTSPETTSRGSK